MILTLFEKRKKDFVNAAVQRHEHYIKKSKESLPAAVSIKIINIRRNRKTKPRKQKWEEKQICMNFLDKAW